MALLVLLSALTAFSINAASFLSPCALAAAQDGKHLYVACATANRVQCFDLESRKVTGFIALPSQPTGLTLSANGADLFVTCSGPDGKVLKIDLAKAKVVDQFKAGHTPMAPVASADGKTLFVCNRFNNDVSIIDLQGKRPSPRVAVQREPVAAALTRDGHYLLVANLLPTGRADVEDVAAVVSVINVDQGRVAKEIRLPNGSGSLNDLRVSPDGKFAVVTHLLARFHLPASQVDRGWMNANAATIIDLASLEILNTVLLDDAERGAANPWGVAWSADGTKLVVAHAGTHELSIIDFPGLLNKLTKLNQPFSSNDGVARAREDVSHDLSFLVGLRERVPLNGELGPRPVLVAGNTAFVANYFSDSLSVVNVAAERARVESIPLGPKVEPDAVRLGERYFHDATLCFQGWQSCASCHPGDARVDGLNWDLLNDGIGNPKNNKSLLLAHRTPPSMSLGIRDTAETAVRSGIQFILFTRQPESVACAIDEYLKALKPVPSPYLVHGKLSSKAARGAKVFARADCVGCHPAGVFTDLHSYDVGTQGRYDKPTDRFDTPTLVELWRTAPYLHDGSAATVREVLTNHNPSDKHGRTSQLSSEEIDELCEYLLSL